MGRSPRAGAGPKFPLPLTRSPRAHPSLLLPCHLFSPSPFPFPFLCLSFSLSICLSVSLCLSLYSISVSLTLCFCLNVCVDLSLSLCLCCLFPSVSLCVSVSLPSISALVTPPPLPLLTLHAHTTGLALQALSPLLTHQEFLLLVAPVSEGVLCIRVRCTCGSSMTLAGEEEEEEG